MGLDRLRDRRLPARFEISAGYSTHDLGRRATVRPAHLARLKRSREIPAGFEGTPPARPSPAGAQ